MSYLFQPTPMFCLLEHERFFIPVSDKRIHVAIFNVTFSVDRILELVLKGTVS